jgi:hypothetical protein
MFSLDYAATAELYPSRGANRRGHIRYRRFDSVAEALRYAIEEMPADFLRGALLEVDERRFEGGQIKALYEAEAYPLARGPLRC